MNATTPLSPAVAPAFRRLYRAHVSPQHSRATEVTAFVEASSRETAIRKIAQALVAIEFGSTEESVRERIYNCAGAAELIAENISEDHAARLFECGWSGDKVIAWVSAPLVLLADPEPLLRAWARVTSGERS